MPDEKAVRSGGWAHSLGWIARSKMLPLSLSLSLSLSEVPVEPRADLDPVVGVAFGRVDGVVVGVVREESCLDASRSE